MKKTNVLSFKIIIQFVFILCLFTLDILNSVAQPKQLQFKYLTPNDGLSSSAVLTVLQDHKGFMWIGTDNGLNRYDGYNFKIYKNSISDSTSLPGDQVKTLLEDRNKNILVGTNLGLSLYDWTHDRFINYRNEKSSPLFGIDIFIFNITEDSIGNLWLSTNIALIYFDRTNNTVVQYTHDPNNPESLSNSFIENVFIDSKNRTWVSTRGGLNLFQPTTGTFKHITRGENSADDYSEIAFTCITEDHEGNIWIGSANGLYCIKNSSDISEPILTRYYHFPDDKYNFSGNRLLSVFVDNENNLWGGAENGGLFLIDKENLQLWQYKTDEYNPASLNNNSIQYIYQDDSENLWIGTFAGGLNISIKNSEAIFHYKNLNGSEQSLSNNVVSSFLLDHDGQIWVGTDGGGFNQFNVNTKRFTRFNKDNSGLSSNVILSMVEDNNHTIWMGTWGGGLISYNNERNRFTSFTLQNSKIPDNNIFSVAVGKHNDLWLGSFAQGLIHYQIDKNEFTNYIPGNSSIMNNYVFVVKIDNKGQLYFGTTTGMQIFSPEENRFVTFLPDQNDPNSLSNGDVYDILIENDTCVWVATQNGLNRLNPKTQVFKKYFKEDGLPDNVIKSLLKDNTGVLWVATNMGICRFDYQHNKYDNYTQEDGLQSNEFKDKSALLLKNGDLLFGGTNGFNRISPDRIIKNTNIPKIVITDFFLFNKPVSANTKGSPLKTNISDTKEIELPHNQSVLTFYFSALDFTMPEKNQYAYKLENFDDDWIYSGSKREATYTNLDPGTYILRVKGSNNDGVWNEEGTSIKITILPLWWLTWYFKIIYAVLIISLIIAIYYFRTSNLRKQKEILKKTVEERTHDLFEKNTLLEYQSKELVKINSLQLKNQKTIEAQSEELKVTAENLEKTNVELVNINATKDKFFNIIAHDLRGPFGNFLGLTEIMVEELPNLTMNEIQTFTVSMKNSATNLFRLLENLLQWARMQQGSFSYKREIQKLFPIIDESVAVLQEIAKSKDIVLSIDIAEDLKVFADSNVIQMVVRNLLSNALKFTNKGGKVSLSAKAVENFVNVSVEDSGIGMSKNMIENLFLLDTKTNRQGTDGEPSTGLGLILCKELIEKQGGKLWVESEEGTGSVFYFSIYSSPDDVNLNK